MEDPTPTYSNLLPRTNANGNQGDIPNERQRLIAQSDHEERSYTRPSANIIPRDLYPRLDAILSQENIPREYQSLNEQSNEGRTSTMPNVITKDADERSCATSSVTRKSVIIIIKVVVVLAASIGIGVYFSQHHETYDCTASCVITNSMIDCRSRHCNVVPSRLFNSSYSTIDLSGNDINNVPELAFIRAPMVEVILLNSSNVMSISMKAFFGLFHIMSLNLSDNQLHTILYNTFNGMSFPNDLYGECRESRGLSWNECSVNLKSNPIESIELGAFQDSQGLRVFLGATDSMTVQTDAFMFGGVYDIVFDSIKELRLARNAFHAIIQSRFITILNSTIPMVVSDTFGGINGLESLVVANCTIGHVSRKAFGGITFSGNSDSPTNITIMYSLIHSSFSQDSFQGSNMKEIIFQMNHLTGFKAFAFRGLATEKLIFKENTNLNQIGQDSFANIEEVKQGIYFHDNDITAIQSNSFQNSKENTNWNQ
ncbi:unnamed protein product, partial [Owenia fusiformis]